MPAKPAGAGTGQDTEMLRRRWPEVLETVKGMRRASWILVGQNAQVQGLDASMLVLSFPTQGLVDRFRDHADVIARAVRETLGFDVHVQATVGGASATSSGAGTTTAPTPAASGTSAGGTPAARPARGRGIPSAEEAAASWDAPARPSAPDASGSSEAGGSGSSAPGSSRSSPPGGSGSSAPGSSRSSPPGGSRSSAQRPSGSSSAPRSSVGGPVPADEGAGDPAPGPRPVPDDDLDDPPIDPPDDELPDDLPPEEPAPTADPGPDEPSDDDPVIEGSNLVGAPLVARLLGGTVIDEQVDGPEV